MRRVTMLCMGRMLLAVCCALSAEIAFAQAATERFDNPTAGVSLTRPAGWETVALQSIQENRARVQLSDAELQAAMQRMATAPLFAFMKHPEPFSDVNPSIQVVLRPLGQLAGQTPTAILNAAIDGMSRAMADFAFVTPVSDARVAGAPAAHMRATFTMKTQDGAAYKALARMWIVPRGAYMLLIGMSGPQAGPDVSEAEFAETLASIRLQ